MLEFHSKLHKGDQMTTRQEDTLRRQEEKRHLEYKREVSNRIREEKQQQAAKNSLEITHFFLFFVIPLLTIAMFLIANITHNENVLTSAAIILGINLVALTHITLRNTKEAL